MVVLNAADGAKQFQRWNDTARGEDCAFVETTAGYRCLPIGAERVSPASAFADAACTVPVQGFLVSPAPGCETGGYVTTTAASAGSCPSDRKIDHVFRIGSRLSSVFYRPFSTCELFSGPTEFYRFGEEIPLSEFQGATETIE